MNRPSPQFTSKLLVPSKTSEQYSLYRAGLEWNLTDPIIIENKDDLKSQSSWHGKVEPYHHQVKNLINFCRRLPVALLADDVGLGKTISAGLIASELIARKHLKKILIICPKLLTYQWQEELDKKFNIPAKIAIGNELLNTNLDEDVGAIITTYNSARLYIEKIPETHFQMLILDEAHKLRNLFGTRKTPQVATTFQRVLENRMFKYVLMLTATPIQNRLWDIYSLVDLLTTARGHENPFGGTGLFARNYIADNRSEARQLNPEMVDQFRAIVYQYMSRVRRDDVDLCFPERQVYLRKIAPTEEELELISIISKPIQKLNPLVQISILQALTSSPEALAAQLKTMARKGTVENKLSRDVSSVVKTMGTSAKLESLMNLIETTSQEKPYDWRLIIFTGRIETQTTIQAYLESKGITVGIINGTTGDRNQETIKKFKKTSPEIHVIISTEAGSEGVNLQAASILVNYDLPWNPMIVEQRIGRIQRLAAEHSKVFIYNMVLKGTFEEYIVGRLLEKLQMASQAIGDIESLLEATGMNAEDSNEAIGFEEQIRRMVLDALAGRDTKAAALKAEESIEKAKKVLEEEEANINKVLGRMDSDPLSGPIVPKLPPQNHSMDIGEFTQKALKFLGAQLSEYPEGNWLCHFDDQQNVISIGETLGKNNPEVLNYNVGSSAFDNLVKRITSSGTHAVSDLDKDTNQIAQSMANEWVKNFQGHLKNITIEEVQRCFSGTALVLCRMTVAHDSYERLLEIKCSPNIHKVEGNIEFLSQISNIPKPESIGINSAKIAEDVLQDEGLAEFSRFYLDRMAEEVNAARTDERKRKKLEDDFTPRLNITLLGLEGHSYRNLKLNLQYGINNQVEYTSQLILTPSKLSIIHSPKLETCAYSQQSLPEDCLSICQITKLNIARDFLRKSDISNRYALPEHMVTCSYSGKSIISDEADISSVTGNLVSRTELKTSEISGLKAEPNFLFRCNFTSTQGLKHEMKTSEVSSKIYRADEEEKSSVSGMSGHASEFISCSISDKKLLPDEAQTCEITKTLVSPGILEPCSISGKNVLPTELDISTVSNQKALKSYFVTSNMSGTKLLEQESVKSSANNHCSFEEARICSWSGKYYHPEDLRSCTLTGIVTHKSFITSNGKERLQPLSDLLEGLVHSTDENQKWDDAILSANKLLSGRWTIISSVRSPDTNAIAISAEVKTLLGFRVRKAGYLYSLKSGTIIGRIAQGKHTADGWTPV